jgi:hypothetical protein
MSQKLKNDERVLKLLQGSDEKKESIAHMLN